MSALVAGVDSGTAHERDADALAQRVGVALRGAGAQDVLVATHWVGDGAQRHVALSVSASLEPHALAEAVAPLGLPAVLVGDTLTGSADLRPGLDDAVRAARARTSGRAVVFAGCERLTGTLPAGDVPRLSAIAAVAVLGAGDADPDVPLVTRDFVRPRFVAGRLVLHVQPAAGGVLVPFEVPDPTPCCVDHG